MWLKELQIAIIEKNTDAIDKLLDSTPKFDKVDDIHSAMYLLREASVLLHTLKDETSNSMKQIKKNLQFLDSIQAPATPRLDIKS